MQSQDLSAISNHMHCWNLSQAEEKRLFFLPSGIPKEISYDDMRIF